MTNLNIRWIFRRDLPEVLAIEGVSFAAPWDEERFIYHLRQRNTIGMVAEVDHQVVGYQVYELHLRCLVLGNLAVAPSHCGQGIGTALVQKLIGKLSPIRPRLVADVCEKNLSAQLFFKSLGFRAVRVIREHFEDGQDAYQMVYRVGATRTPNNIQIKEARK